MFTDAELWQLSYCVGEELRARTAGKTPGPQPWLRNLLQSLETALTASRPRHSEDGGDADSWHEAWIGTTEAATILGWTTRKVQRHKEELGGQSVGAQLIFRTETVRAHAKAMTNA